MALFHPVRAEYVLRTLSFMGCVRGAVSASIMRSPSGRHSLANALDQVNLEALQEAEGIRSEVGLACPKPSGARPGTERGDSADVFRMSSI